MEKEEGRDGKDVREEKRREGRSGVKERRGGTQKMYWEMGRNKERRERETQVEKETIWK